MMTAPRFEAVSLTQSRRTVPAIKEVLAQLEAGDRRGLDDPSLPARLQELEARARSLRHRGGPFASVRLSPAAQAIATTLKNKPYSGLGTATEGVHQPQPVRQ